MRYTYVHGFNVPYPVYPLRLLTHLCSHFHLTLSLAALPVGVVVRTGDGVVVPEASGGIMAQGEVLVTIISSR